jgi:glycosyltransferase involved in cell wall biosynthesis
MRICTVNARFVGQRMTGVQRAAHEIVSRLILDQGQCYRLFSPRLNSNNVGPLPVKQQGYIRQGHLWEQLELPRIVRRMGRDAVLYSPMTSGPLAVTRQVLTIHDLFVVENPEWFSRAYSVWYRWLMPRLVRRVAYILANSQYTRQRILERYGVPEDKVVLCHFAQNERFTPAPAELLAQFRVDQGLPERYLLFIGSIEPRKNLATLAAAWKQTTVREQGVKLVVAGGAARKAVFNTASSRTNALEDPTIHKRDYFSDKHLPLLYQAADAFVLPSLAEGFGLPILEAMACGSPVICSDTTAMPEVAGGAARLVPALDIEAWAEAIDSVEADVELRRRMRSDGLKRAANFSWSRTADTVRAVLQRSS